MIISPQPEDKCQSMRQLKWDGEVMERFPITSSSHFYFTKLSLI